MSHIFLDDVKHRNRGTEWFSASRGDGALQDLFERLLGRISRYPP